MRAAAQTVTIVGRFAGRMLLPRVAATGDGRDRVIRNACRLTVGEYRSMTPDGHPGHGFGTVLRRGDVNDHEEHEEEGDPASKASSPY